MAWAFDDIGTITINLIQEGFLTITNIIATPSVAHVGETVTITMYFENTGDTEDNFMWEAIDTFDSSQIANGTILSLPALESTSRTFNMVMPARAVTIQVKTYHEE